MSRDIHEQHNELAGLIERHCFHEGIQKTAIPSLYLIRYSNTTEPDYAVYKPCLCFITKGSKQIFLANERYTYNPANYLIASMNLPVVGQVIKATSDEPYLSLKLEFTKNQILEILTDSGMQPMPKGNSKRALFVGQMEPNLIDAILRLARLLDQPDDIPFLAPLFTREILYRLLQGEYGITLAQIAMEGCSTYRIRDAIEQIMQHYNQPLRIDELAELACMSVSSFHRNFKEVTAMSPIQFQKELRLQEARRLLLSEASEAAEVAYRVGYESASQFSREYSRMFGSPPRADIKRLKENYEQRRNA
ncbi:AraC family transcriptional regulator [Paenibacillus sp. D2_2]|uniref:AraC family transcriptional regulator n=1 Tax=Paenibacillus sp. D2_2 TaxID=3073092 RepID=UPI0028164681|nr:AraC family transcriptional regulator [Paenibacillus sp. D2_2]WMT43112.1 AraC family transcriptional regulator [Paenibacillus sp. D2_2]